MSDTLAIHGHDIIDLVSQYPDGIRLSKLMEVVDERFGKSVTFHTCSSMKQQGPWPSNGEHETLFISSHRHRVVRIPLPESGRGADGGWPAT